MTELQRLRGEHAAAVLAFERFGEQHDALLAEQDAGAAAFHVLVAEDGRVLGRFNLRLAGADTAELG